jgi:HAD superfamily hydrolase (TIGR01509 family)
MQREIEIQGVVLDVDGTLVDSNDRHTRAWCDALEACGFRAPFRAVRRLIGMGSDKLIPRITGHAHETAIGKKLSKLRGERFREDHLARVRPFDGSRALVERFLERGIRVAIASSAAPKERDALLEIAGVAELLEEKKKNTDAAKSKPDPDIVRAALAKLDLPARRVLMIGDTPYDVQAGAVAGIRTIAFRSGGEWDDDELIGALAIVDGPRALERSMSQDARRRVSIASSRASAANGERGASYTWRAGTSRTTSKKAARRSRS